MKINLILATIIISIIAFSQQNEIKYDQITNCLKTESISNLNRLVMDLYYNKINVNIYWKKFVEWGVKYEAESVTKCVPTKFFKKNLESSTILTKLGLSLLYTSNCEKDLGPSLIILDNVISNLQNIKEEWKSALTNALAFGLIGYQTYGDCKTAVETIIEIWNH